MEIDARCTFCSDVHKTNESKIIEEYYEKPSEKPNSTLTLTS